jgi:hypothetical protein
LLDKKIVDRMAASLISPDCLGNRGAEVLGTARLSRTDHHPAD